MGFSSWFLKNGPGSPGSTAKHLSNQLINVAAANGLTSIKGFEMIYYSRANIATKINNRTNNFNNFDPDTLFTYAKGDISLLTFIILYIETEQFRKGIRMDVNGFDASLKAIWEVSHTTAPIFLLTLDYISYKSLALKFMDDIYPDCVN